MRSPWTSLRRCRWYFAVLVALSQLVALLFFCLLVRHVDDNEINEDDKRQEDLYPREYNWQKVEGLIWSSHILLTCCSFSRHSNDVAPRIRFPDVFLATIRLLRDGSDTGRGDHRHRSLPYSVRASLQRGQQNDHHYIPRVSDLHNTKLRQKIVILVRSDSCISTRKVVTISFKTCISSSTELSPPR
jgi:hypothetical protein